VSRATRRLVAAVSSKAPMQLVILLALVTTADSEIHRYMPNML
jgi:hypothetical protein